MAHNAKLNRAKDAKVDEFYTRREDIESELAHYESFFEGKTVYCNCDDPEISEFWQFFRRVFKSWKLKRLIATHYEPDTKNYAYMLDLIQDTNGDGMIDRKDEPIVTPLPCNGDFRSAACIELLKQADIVVTNPPFSLFREYIAQLIEYKKEFLILGALNAVKYKEIFPYIKRNEITLGFGPESGAAFYRIPNHLYDPKKVGSKDYTDENGNHWVRVNGVRWFTNLPIAIKKPFIDLRGNYYREGEFPRYYNYNAIDVSKVNEIPIDYDGKMGVPISLLDKYNPEQFEIIGVSNVNGLLDDVDEIGEKWMADYKSSGGTGHITSKMHSLVGYDSSGKPKSFYSRIVIRNKNPEPRRYPDED